MRATSRAGTIEYAIRDVMVPASKLEKKGIELLKLNIGDPNKFDFKTPQHILDAVCRSLENVDMGYTPSEGFPELREEILNYEKKKNGIDASSEDIIVTNGVSEAINMLFGASLQENDNVLLPDPCYSTYSSMAKYYGAVPVEYKTIEEDDWVCDIDSIRKNIDENTKCLVLINPNNPTGALIPKKEVKEVVDICGEHDIFLISDEIYDKLTFGSEFYSPVSCSKDVPVVLLNGFSKLYLVPGWRVGYIGFHDPEGKINEIEEAVKKMARMRLCPNAPCQMACHAALTGSQDHVKELVSKLKVRRDFAYKRINEIDGLETRKPEGAFYIFPKITHPAWTDDKKFVLDVLHNSHVLFVHGSGFSTDVGNMHFRSVFLPPVDMMDKAFSKVEDYLRSVKA